MKYFVLGAIASGMLLYGISIIYGVTGTLQLDELAVGVREVGTANLGLIFGLAFIIVGIAFKFGAVPFHMWVPDVYHGAPTPVTLFIGSAPKIAVVRLAIRVLADGLDAMVAELAGHADACWRCCRWSIGNLVAIAQTQPQAHARVLDDLARRLHPARHSGRHRPKAIRASMFYTLSYVITTVGSFGMILLLSRSGFEADRLEDFKGLNRRSPWFAAIMMMLMFSTAGVPPFIGFWAKLAVLGAVLDVGLAWLAAVAVVLSVVGAFYYLRVVKLMYFDDPTETHAIEAGGTMRAVLSANGVAVLALGVFPSALIDLCARVLP